jgi:RNA polymerase sigma-70 factor (sigma-E family)
VSGWPDDDFDAFVAARLPALTRFAYSLTGDMGHAEDVVQTALIKTYLATRRSRPDSPEAYVRRAVVSAHLARFRRRRVVEVLSPVLPEQRAARDENRTEIPESMAERLACLSPRQCAVMVLRYVEDWTETDIADAMGVTAGTVKTLAHRALERLRDTTAGTAMRTQS